MRIEITQMSRFSYAKQSANLAPLSMRFCLIFVLWLVSFPSAFAELIAGKPAWGFDGTAVRNSFNVLTVSVQNAGAQAFEGEVVLDIARKMGSADIAPLVQSIFLAPGTSRTVQFFPYLVGYYEDFEITWKDQMGGGVPVDPPKFTAPAVVVLADLDAASIRALRMPAFHEGNFPPTIAATDALRAVVLDHQPRWDAARREAFLDWVKRGGVVHVIQGPEGGHPQFTDEFAILNSTGARGHVGAGVVVKHPVSRADVTLEYLENSGFPKPETSNENRGYGDVSDNGIFRVLGEATKPDISWGTIYGLTFAYIALIGPVFYFQRRRDYRWLLGGFVATVILFAWVFTIVGRRGYGEKQIYHSVALARAIEGNKWEVRHWMYPFATSGSDYRFSFAGGTHVYGARGNSEAVRASVIQGKDGYFEADIPLFSSRPFQHQGVMTGPKLDWQFEKLVPGDNLTKLREARVKLADGSSQVNLHSVTVQIKSQFYSLTKVAEWWTFASANPTDVVRAFGSDGMDPEFDQYGQPARSSFKVSPHRLASVVSGARDNESYPLGRALEDGWVRVFAYADSGAFFPLSGTDFQPGMNSVLFVQDLPLAKP